MALQFKNLARIGQLSARQFPRFSGGFSVKPEPDNPNWPEHTRKFKELQKLYQVGDDVPVHLKRGTRDKALYYITWAFIFLGLEESGRFFLSLK